MSTREVHNLAHPSHHLHISFHVKDVGVEGLSRVTLRPENRDSELQALAAEARAEEVFYLSTCNRIEFYFVGAQPLSLPGLPLGPTQVRKKVRDIIEHLLGVALSMDSLVFGESQILGQFKRAYETSLENGHVRGRLSPLLNAIIREAKAIRTRVGLTQVHTSVATVAGQIVAAPSVHSVLFVGAGETNQTFAQYLKKRIPQVQLFWCTRSHQRSETAVKNCGGHQIPWTALAQTELLPQADLLCVATHSPDILVGDKVLEAVNPRTVVDLSVPANASINDVERLGIRYIGIDELNEHLHNHKAKSEKLLAQLNDEIRQSALIILNEWNNRKAGGFISEIHTASENILEMELESLNHRLHSLPESERRLVQEWSRRLIKKINHLHFETLKRVLSTESQEDSDSTLPISDEQPHG